jgi:hypothetical protein
VPIPLFDGVLRVKHEHLWGLGYEVASGYGPIWGLFYAGRRTQMCYGADYAPPAEAVAKVREFGWWYFDAGRALRVKTPDLEIAFGRLGLLDAYNRWARYEKCDACHTLAGYPCYNMRNDIPYLPLRHPHHGRHVIQPDPLPQSDVVIVVES